MGTMSLDINVISAKRIFVPSLRMIGGIYISINHRSKTSINPLLCDDSVLWNETVTLTNVSTTFLIELRAVFESGSDTTIGRGELIAEAQPSLQDLLIHGGRAVEIPFTTVRDINLHVPVLTLKVSLRISAYALPDPIAEFETISADVYTDRAPLDSIVKHNTNTQPFDPDGPFTQYTDAGHAHFAEYMVGHGDSHLKDALECFENAIQECPKKKCPNARAAALTNLAWARLTAFVHNHPQHDVHTIITQFREALELRPLGHPDHALSMFHLAHALNHLHLHNIESSELGVGVGIWEAAALFHTLLHICPKEESGTSFHHSVINGHSLDDVIRKCNELPIVVSYNDIVLRQTVVMLCPAGHGRRGDSLEMLSRTLCAHGGIDAINQSVCYRREIVEMHHHHHHHHHPAEGVEGVAGGESARIHRSITLNRLADSLNYRFTLMGESHDQQEIIELCKESLWLNPTIANRGCVMGELTRLGVALVKGFLQGGRDTSTSTSTNTNTSMGMGTGTGMGRMDDAIGVFRSVWALGPERENGVYMLVLALLTSGSREHLMEAIELCCQTGFLDHGGSCGGSGDGGDGSCGGSCGGGDGTDTEHGRHVGALSAVFNRALMQYKAEIEAEAEAMAMAKIEAQAQVEAEAEADRELAGCDPRFESWMILEEPCGVV